jgi:hypothetical protein
MPEDEALDETLDYLASRAAEEAIAADPYWPKWDGPWWRLVLLAELGLADRAPRARVLQIVRAIDSVYLKAFPFTPGEVPLGKDPIRQIACHCQIGTIDTVLRLCGIEVDRELPWLRTWYLKYQIADGGWNCDEAVYTRPTPRSSVVSTLPVLEGLLARGPALTPEESLALDRGAEYLIARRLVRSLSKGGVVAKEEWLRPAFPRFYEYDLLRGLSFLVRWAEWRGRTLPEGAIAEVVTTLEGLAPRGVLAPGRRVTEGPRTLRRDASGVWVRGPAGTFPLLESVSAVGTDSPWLTRAWLETRRGLDRLRESGRLVTGE